MAKTVEQLERDLAASQENYQRARFHLSETIRLQEATTRRLIYLKQALREIVSITGSLDLLSAVEERLEDIAAVALWNVDHGR